VAALVNLGWQRVLGDPQFITKETDLSTIGKMRMYVFGTDKVKIPLDKTKLLCTFPLILKRGRIVGK